MAIKITSKKKKFEIKSSEEFNILFNFSIFFLMISLIVYGILFYIGRTTNYKIYTVREEIEKMESEAVNFRNQEKELENYKKIIKDYSQIFNQRKIASDFLPMIETSVHPKALFRDISVSLDTGITQIKGYAYDLETIEQQYHLFKMLKFEKGDVEKSNIISPINEVRLNSMSEINEDPFRFSFDITLSLNPEMFKP